MSSWIEKIIKFIIGGFPAVPQKITVEDPCLTYIADTKKNCPCTFLKTLCSVLDAGVLKHICFIHILVLIFPPLWCGLGVRRKKKFKHRPQEREGDCVLCFK